MQELRPADRACTPWATARPSLMAGESNGCRSLARPIPAQRCFPLIAEEGRRAALRIPAFTGEQFMGTPLPQGGNRGMCRSPSRLPAARLAAARRRFA